MRSGNWLPKNVTATNWSDGRCLSRRSAYTATGRRAIMKCSLGRTILWLVVLRSCARKCLVWDAGLRVPLRSTPLGSQRRCKCSFGLVRVNRLGVKPRGTRPAPPVDLISVPLSLGHNPPCPVSLVAVGSCPERCLSFDDNCQSDSTAAAVGGLWDGLARMHVIERVIVPA